MFNPMKRATKDFIILFVLGMVFAFGFASVVFGIGSYFSDMANFLTPDGILGYGFGMMIASSIGIAILFKRKRKLRK